MRSGGKGWVITIPVGLELAAGILWVLAVLLMMGAMRGGDDFHVWWSLMVGLAAVSATGAALMRYHRRVLMQVIAWEFQVRDEHRVIGPGPDLRVVE